MTTQNLAKELTREHHEVDAAIEQFVSELAGGNPRERPLLDAIGVMRRHIYLEEAFLFPPVREAGMVMPIMVMLREHGELWRTMDEIVELLALPGDDGRLATSCRTLLARLDAHNTKEEPIVYPHADVDLTPEAQADLARFIEIGHAPDGWVCQYAES